MGCTQGPLGGLTLYAQTQLLAGVADAREPQKTPGLGVVGESQGHGRGRPELGVDNGGRGRALGVPVEEGDEGTRVTVPLTALDQDNGSILPL